MSDETSQSEAAPTRKTRVLRDKAAGTLERVKLKTSAVATAAKGQAVQTVRRAEDLGAKAARTVTDATKRGAKAAKGRAARKDNELKGQVIVQDLSEELKVCYLGALIWLTYQDDCEIDEREVCELQILMTQVACDIESRRVVRDKIADPAGLDPEKIVPRILELTPDETREAMGFSLLKDAIRLDRATADNGSPRTRGGISVLAGLLEANDEQVAFVEEACIQDQKILDGKISDHRIVGIAKELAAKSTGVGVPITAVYLSGSVTGLSAAGITSGLAALGLGGVLGLSAMVTGVGTAVVGGVVIYRGTRWLMGRKGRIKAGRRELMLQEVLRIHQKAIANLAEDIAYFGDQLVELTSDVERNQLVINKLAREMTLLGNALAQLRQKEHTLEDALEVEIDRNGRPTRANEEADAAGR